MQMERFFNELVPRLQTAKALDEELDRNLARRFNVLDYLRTDELGLSRIIADLLDPTGSHGQGVLFLRAFLERLRGFQETLRWPDLGRRTSVRCEEKITGERRIDVVVEIKGPAEETHSMVLENKPYAHDQESQVKDYLKSRKEDDWYLLVYLSPRGSGPSEESIPKGELKKKWKDHFAIMPYVGGQEWKDEFDGYRLPRSLADWLGKCRKNCEVDRLRWFLRDVERFCERRFGGQAMTTDFEAKAVEEYVLLDSDRLRTAEAVYESWPEIKNGVCRRFLERLCSAIECRARENEKLKEFRSDMQVRHPQEGEREEYWICLYRECWAQYKGGNEEYSDRRTAILLINDKSGPNHWFVGVSSPMLIDSMECEEKERRERLRKELAEAEDLGGKKSAPWYPWWDWMPEDKKNWDVLVPDLHKENQEDGGEITDCFVHKFICIAEKTAPIINRIEAGNSKA